MAKHVTKDVVRERLLKIIPKAMLDDLAKDAGVERPWDDKLGYFETASKGATKSAMRQMKVLWEGYCLGQSEEF